MNIRWNQVAIAAAAGFLAGALFSDFYRSHRGPALPPMHGMDGPIEMFSRELGLSSDQQKKVQAVFEKYQPEMQKVMEANRPLIDKVRDKMKAEMNAILTPEQAKKMAGLEKDFEKNGPHGMHGGPGPRGPGCPDGRGPGGPQGPEGERK